MAIYHFSAQLISRSHGRSIVAAAAYRAAECLADERTGLTHDYTRKSDVLERTLLLPSHAPAEFQCRETLWNAIEHAEKRKDAQLARDINIALPRELTPEQNWALLTTFVQTTFVAEGMVADVTFHRGHGDEDQPHGHILLTLRELTPLGFGFKVRDWNAKALLQDWRQAWAMHCNHALAQAGLDVRIDHRTLEAQGINLEAQSKIGPKAAQSAMARLAEHQDVARRNGERLLADPTIALHALTRQQSTFTSHDLARFVHRHTVDAAQFDAVYHRIKAHPELIALPSDEATVERFTTREQLQLETQLIEQALEKATATHHPVSDKQLTHALTASALSEEQTLALKHLTQGADLACVVGFAGTGKSYVLGVARQAWEEAGYRVQGMALSGIAAQQLTQGAAIESHTVAHRLMQWTYERERLSVKDILVVDEAGMLGSRQLAAILNEVHASGAKVVLVGDPEQLQAIEAGAAFRAILERVGFSELTDIRRQRESWQQEATRDFARARTRDGLMAYEQHDEIHTFSTHTAALDAMVKAWDVAEYHSPPRSQLMLAYTREEVQTLNEQARACRRARGELGVDVLFDTPRGERTFAVNERIYFLRNDRQLAVKNGTLGTIEAIQGKVLTVKLDTPEGTPARTITVDVNNYNALDHGYAATVYKAQGVTVERTHVLASPYFDRHTTYVAMSRHREQATLYVGQDEFPRFYDVAQTFSRARAKDMTLDYIKDSQAPLRVSKPTLDIPTPERLQAAEARLAQRQLAREKVALEAQVGLTLTFELNEGDSGIYRGKVELGDKRYGLMEQTNKQGTLIPLDILRATRVGKSVTIERYKPILGQAQLRACHLEERGFDLEL